MKYLPLILIFSALFLTGCQESSSKKKSSSSQNALCIGTGYYTVPGCPGYSGNTTGTTVGGTTGTNPNCYGNANWTVPGCPGYCQNYPAYCNGTTTGGTTGGTTNPYDPISSNPIYMNWGQHYPGGEPPVMNCPSAVAPSGISYTPYETRKATMTVQGGTFYNPASGVPYANTSAILKTVSGAKSFLSTDSLLQVRFKVNLQPENDSGAHYCYIPNYSPMSSQAGHYYVRFSVSVVGTKANGTVEEDFIGTFHKRVNECTPPIDLSNYASVYPGGMYLKVYDVQDNTKTWPYNYAQYGFRDGTAYRTVRSMDCWSLDVEVAADGTKVFPN